MSRFRHLRHGQVRGFCVKYNSSQCSLAHHRLINYPLTIGVPVIVLPKFIDTLFFESIQKYKITYAFLVPPIILHLANNPLASKYDLSSLSNVMSGAAPLGAGLTKKVKQRFPKINVSQGYGEIKFLPLRLTIYSSCCGFQA
jgi:acyl-CoA synthetase (AMP-forming)/AMP-acid ligase II